jgi:hypothetical protein
MLLKLLSRKGKEDESAEAERKRIQLVEIANKESTLVNIIALDQE